LKTFCPSLKTVLPNTCLRRGFGRQADIVIAGHVDPRSPQEMAASPISRGEPLRDEGPFGDHTRYAGNPKVESRSQFN